MSEHIKPAILPDKYRKHVHEPTPTLGTMKNGETSLVDLKDIKVDANWGVWINPDARFRPAPAIASSLTPSAASSVVFPIVARKTEQGYALTLKGALRELVGQMTNEPAHTSFTGMGFIPASTVE